MIARLLAALGLLAAALVLVTAGPAAACGCVTDRPDQMVANADVAFIGVLTHQRADDDDIAHRFTVDAVHKGEVHRTQDVVTPNAGEATCGVTWESGAQMVVLGYLDEESRISANLCTGSATRGEATYDAVVAALGQGVEPLPGQAAVELDRWEDLRWFTLALAVGMTGLAALGVLVRRRRRG